ncbi:cytochrome P450 [Streptomyces sp. x-80]|jgi:hypothetical protein|uniref:cytochrome P450 n=1 Tax=Streptomyces sp. x-80 TaxID=2789282 RepID=UPI00397FF094
MSEAFVDVARYPMSRGGCPFDPPPTVDRPREQGAVIRMRLPDGSTPWLVTGYPELRAVLSDSRFSADPSKPGYPPTAGNPTGEPEPGMFGTMDDPEHARLRRMLTRDFVVKRAEAARPAIQQIVDEKIDEMLRLGGPVDLVEAFALPVPSLVICELLGVPYADHAFFEDRSAKVLSLSPDQTEKEAAELELRDYLGTLLAAKGLNPADDLLSRLAVDRVRTGDLTDEEATTFAVLLLVAGHETTANMIALGILALLRHPDQLALLRDSDDPKLIANAVEELLRYLSVVHSGLSRVAVEDVEIGGQVIKAGEGVILAVDGANRDSTAFPDPARLDLRRTARHHAAFGYGIHQCLGQQLARVELTIAYPTLLRRIPGLRLATALEEIPFRTDMGVYGVHQLPVTW